jgi:starvation-inducible DNA-binding protein
MKLYQSSNDRPSNAKAVSIGVLNARLADAIDLALSTKRAHWNIKEPQFIALHEMIDGFRTQLDPHVDTMTERVVQKSVAGHDPSHRRGDNACTVSDRHLHDEGPSQPR